VRCVKKKRRKNLKVRYSKVRYRKIGFGKYMGLNNNEKNQDKSLKKNTTE
jgi:hypothetical protein